MKIDPTRMALKRRASTYQKGKILLSNFSYTDQIKDLEKTKGHVKGAIEEFYRIKTNIKDDVMQEFYRTGNNKVLMFDFNWWPLTKLNGKQEEFNDVFIYQLKGCNAACPFCFVDRFNNNGQKDHGAEFFTVEEIVDSFVEIREKLKKEGKEVNVLRASGGEPSLVPEQWLALLQEIDKRGLSSEVYVHSDTNLTTGRAINYLMEKGEIDKHLLEKVAEYDNFGLLACFKGDDPVTFSDNTKCGSEYFKDSFYSFDKLVKAGLAVYPHLINPNPKTVENFMEKLSGQISNDVYNLIHILKLGADYGPGEKEEEKWAENLQQSEDILNDLTNKFYGLDYKQASRPLIVERLYRKK